LHEISNDQYIYILSMYVKLKLACWFWLNFKIKWDTNKLSRTII